MGARLLEAPNICLWATKILIKEPTRVPKTYDSYGNSFDANFYWMNNKIICSFCAFETKM